MTGSNRHSRQLTEINEAFERRKYFFNVDQPVSDLIQHEIVQRALRLPGHESVGGIVTREIRTCRLFEIVREAFEPVESLGEFITGILMLEITARERVEFLWILMLDHSVALQFKRIGPCAASGEDSLLVKFCFVSQSRARRIWLMPALFF